MFYYHLGKIASLSFCPGAVISVHCLVLAYQSYTSLLLSMWPDHLMRCNEMRLLWISCVLCHASLQVYRMSNSVQQRKNVASIEKQIGSIRGQTPASGNQSSLISWHKKSIVQSGTEFRANSCLFLQTFHKS